MEELEELEGLEGALLTAFRSLPRPAQRGEVKLMTIRARRYSRVKPTMVKAYGFFSTAAVLAITINWIDHIYCFCQP